MLLQMQIVLLQLVRIDNHSTKFWYVHLNSAIEKAIEFNLNGSTPIANHNMAGEELTVPWVMRGVALELFTCTRSSVAMRDEVIVPNN